MHYGADEPDEGQFDEMRDVPYVTGRRWPSGATCS